MVLENLKGKLKKQKNKLAKTTDLKKQKTIKKSIAKFEGIIANEAKQKDYYKKEWRTFQLSDHLPMWTELKINFSLSYLEKIKNE